MQLTLEIHDGAQTYAYDDTRILNQEPELGQRIDGRQVEMQDVSVEVGPEGSGDPTFLGYTSLEAIPLNETYRAVIRAGSTVLLNGAIRTQDISWSSKLQSYAVEVFDRAPGLLWDRWEEEFVDMLALLYRVREGQDHPSLSTFSVDTYFEGEDSSGSRSAPESRELDWHDLRSVAHMALTETVASFSLPQPLWTHSFETTNGAVDAPAEPIVFGFGYDFLPGMSVGRFMENLLDLAGLWVTADFQSFPSRDIEVGFQRQTVPSSQDTIDEVELSDAHDRKPVTQRGYGLLYDQEVGASSPNLAEVDSTTLSDNDKAPAPNPAPPPSYATYAPHDWKVEEVCIEDVTGDGVTYDDPRSPNVDNPRRLDFTLAPTNIVGNEAVDVDGTSRQVYYGDPYITDPFPYTRTSPWSRFVTLWDRTGVPDRFRFSGQCEGAKPHIALPYVGGLNDRNWVEWGSQLQSPGPDQFSAVSAAWARAPFEDQDLIHSPLYELVGDYLLGELSSSLQVLSGVEAVSSSWIMHEKQMSLDSGAAEIVARRPVPESDKDADLPQLPQKPGDVWLVRRLEAQIKYLNINGTAEDWLIVHFEPPFAAESRTWKYLIEVNDRDGDNFQKGKWVSLGEFFSTAVSEILITGGNASNSYSIDVRCKPISPDGTNGAFNTERAQNP